MAGVKGETDNDGDYEGAVRGALSVFDGPRAVYEGCRALRKAVTAEWRRRPAEAGLIAAYVSAQLLHLAGELPRYRPHRPRGCAPVPRPADLIAALDEGLRAAAGGGG
jgi:hypothetical protein